MAIVESKTLPTVTPPWLQQAQQAPKQQAPQQNNAPQPQLQQPKVNYAGIAGKLFAKPIGNAISPYFGAGGGATGIGSAVSAGGGTYATGAGLAGTASPINTTVGAAGSSGGFASGLKGSLKGGLGAGIAGFAGGFLGDKIFGGEGGTGGSIGASIGFAAGGPIGAAIGGLLGGAVGGLFGGGAKNSYYGVYQGNSAPSWDTTKSFSTALGKVTVNGKRDGWQAVNPTVKLFQDSDKAVAGMLDDDQLARVKNRLTKGISSHSTRWTQNPQRAETILKRAVKDRYTAAAEGIDPKFGGTFSRVADDKNMAGLINTLAVIDRDRRAGQNIFAGKDVKDGGQAIQVIAERYGLADKKPQPKAIQSKRPTELAKPTGAPVYQGFGGLYGNAPKQDTSGWTYRSGGMGIKGGWVKAQPQFGTVGGYDNALKAKQQQWDQQKQQVDAANAKALGAWEKKVLDAYADNYGQGQVEASAYNVANTGITRSNQVQSANAQGSSANKRNRLFGNVKQQSVKLNRANQNSNASTNAGGLLQQSEVA